MVVCTVLINRRRAIMANFIQLLPIEFMGYTSWPLRSSKEIPPFIDDVTEHTCSHSSLGCLGIHTCNKNLERSKLGRTPKMVKDTCKFCEGGQSHSERKAARGHRLSQTTQEKDEHQSTQSQSTPSNQSTESQSLHSSQSSDQSNPSWGPLFINRQTFVELHLM